MLDKSNLEYYTRVSSNPISYAMVDVILGHCGMHAHTDRQQVFFACNESNNDITGQRKKKQKTKNDSIFSHLSKSSRAVYSTLERQHDTKESFIQNRLRKLKSKCNLLNF